MQRIFDLVFSASALIILTPILLVLIFILKFTGEGEIFFLQPRVGKDKKLFKLFKFATMLKDSPKIGTGTITLDNDPRILPFGKFLRKTKLNELPQLINVFKGEMSVIGPRPQTERCFNAFPISSQNSIIMIRPGLSGIGSIVFRDEELMMNTDNDPDKFYDEIIMPYKGNLEEWYSLNNSIKNYFILIFLTILIVLAPSKKLIWKVFKNLPKPPAELNPWI